MEIPHPGRDFPLLLSWKSVLSDNDAGTDTPEVSFPNPTLGICQSSHVDNIDQQRHAASQLEETFISSRKYPGWPSTQYGMKRTLYHIQYILFNTYMTWHICMRDKQRKACYPQATECNGTLRNSKRATPSVTCSLLSHT